MKMIISPHVDDEVLGCGGILDESVFVLHLGLSESQKHGNTSYTKEYRIKEFSLIKNETNLQSKLLNHPVNNYKESLLISDIEEAINCITPDEIYIPHPSYNQDHREVYNASLVALRPHDINFFVPRVFVYEQPHVFLWDNGKKDFKPNYFKSIDIEKKIDLYHMLKSQVREFRSSDCIRSMAKLRGKQSNLEYAEAFEILRWVDVS